MKTRSSLRGLTLISLTTLLLLALSAGISTVENSAAAARYVVPATEKFRWGKEFAWLNEPLNAAAPAPPCPPPTVKDGNQCVLTADVTLDQTLVLPSGSTLNCQGHKLNAKVTPDPKVNSQPQVGIFLNDVHDVLIERCVLEDFDFGVFAIKSKAPFGSQFHSFLMVDNIINARYTGVSLNTVDNAEIVNSTITYSRAAGRALYIGRDSDSNWVARNLFVANLDAADTPRAFRAPGPESAANLALPIPNQPQSAPRGVVVITQVEGPEPTLLNAVIGNKLFQLTTTETLEPNSKFSDGNRFEGNTIRFAAVPADGVVLAAPQGTQVIGNTIEGGAASAIRVGLQLGTKVFPGTCTLLPSRQCYDNDGCRIAGVDLLNRGTCTPTRTKPVLWVSGDTRIEGNAITGPIGTGIATAGRFTTIIGNTIVGPLRGATGAGIRVAGEFSIETATVTRNSVSAAVALGLVQIVQQAEPISFTAKISLNHFTGYTIGVLTSRTESLTQAGPTDVYDLPSELSVANRGNFWDKGVVCSSLKSADVQNIDHSPNPNVHDQHLCPIVLGP